MSVYRTYWRSKLIIAGNEIRSIRHESRLKIVVVTTWFLLFLVVGWWLFIKGFQFLHDFPVGDLLAIRVIALFFLTLFAMLTFSNVLVAYSTLYKSKETDFLFSLPVQEGEIFVNRFVETLTFSSWAFLFLGVPLMISYGVVFEVRWYFYPALPVFFTPFIVIAGMLGTMLIVIMLRIFPNLSFRALLATTGALVSGFAFFLYRSFSVSRISQLEAIDQILSALKTTQSPFFPSHWLNEGVLAAGRGDLGESAFYLGLLVSNASMLVMVSLGAARFIYYDGWTSLRGHSLIRYYPPGKGVLARLEALIKPLGSPMRSLAMKDLRLFWRDPSQWAQFTIFFGLLIVYITNLWNYEKYIGSEWQTRIAFLNLAAAALVLAVLTTRFVFPLFSLEGKRFWIVGLAPIKRSGLLMQKFVLSIATTLLFTETLMIVSSNALKLDTTITIVCCATMFFMNFSMAGLSVGLGAMYPNFKQDNPARIVSGLGGTLNFILSMLYVTLVVLIEGIVFWEYSNKDGPGRIEALLGMGFQQAIALSLTLVVVISLITAIVPMALGIRNVNRLEF
jgi:ABC-2 type transport system permease protein